MRDNFTEEIKQLLADRVGNRCSNPDCKQLTSGPRTDGKAINLGIAAHITAASIGGPRYDASLCPEERKSINNGIWLCHKCAALIDKDISKYTVDKINKWKSEAEKLASRELETQQKPETLVTASFTATVTLQQPNTYSEEKDAILETKSLNQKIEINNKFEEFLEDTAIKFTHRNRENVSLNDLFVFPELKIINDSLVEQPKIISSENLLAYNKRVLILGDEQSGKTALAKKMFQSAFLKKSLPLFFDGEKINSKIDAQIPNIIEGTYNNISAKEFAENTNVIGIVDDVNLLSNRINKIAFRKFLERLNSIFPHTILFAETPFQFRIPDLPELDDYVKLEIMPFRHVYRSKLIDKWVSLDSSEETDDQQIWAKKDELKTHVNSLVSKNVVPAKPVYILMFLQSFEVVLTHRLELTAYGHCYQYLIYQALNRVHVRQSEIDTYLNILSELGSEFLETLSESFSESDLNHFFDKYSQNFLTVDREKVKRDLIKSSILLESETGIRFKYRYLFYFFAAKKLADSLHKGQKVKEKIKHLVETIHQERSANIILFLTHHSKDPWILDEILYSVMDIFSTEPEVTLEANSLSFLQKFVQEIPDLVVENRDAKQERLNEDIQKDIIEQNEVEDKPIDYDKDVKEFVVKVSKVFRSIEVCGQIFRNRIGSLERQALESVYEESVLVSLRFLNIFTKFSEYVREETVRKLDQILAQNPDMSNQKIMRVIESFYLSINYSVILSMLYRIAFSLGTSKGRDIYIKVTEDKNKPALKLIQLIIELQFEKILDSKKIVNLHSEFHKNPICDRFLKHIVVRHFYMHDTNFSERQKIADKLKIPMSVKHSILIASQAKSRKQ